MRFIVMHKVDAIMEAGGPPNATIIQEMGALVQESLKSGVFQNGAGLHRSQHRARVRCAGSDCTVSKGPYAGDNELVASVAIVSTRSMDEAISQASRFAQAVGDIEIEIGPVVEPWDLGMMPKPEGQLPERFLFLCKGNAKTERSKAENPRVFAEKLADVLGDQGALLAAETLEPTAKAARLPSAAGGKRVWVDGPFAESKELIAGFSILSLPSREAALAWADRYAKILGDNEVDVRELSERT
jgi:hypothetical protein